MEETQRDPLPLQQQTARHEVNTFLESTEWTQQTMKGLHIKNEEALRELDTFSAMQFDTEHSDKMIESLQSERDELQRRTAMLTTELDSMRQQNDELQRERNALESKST